MAVVKNILIYIVVFTVVGTIFFCVQSYFLPETAQRFKSLLLKAYLFHYIFSLALLIVFRLLAVSSGILQQLGFIYLGVLVFKIIAFAALFYPQLFGNELLPYNYRASLLIPVVLFLSLEVFFVSKILRGK